MKVSWRTWTIAGLAGGLVTLIAVTSFGDIHRAVRAAALPDGAFALPGDAATAMLRPCARRAARPIDGHWMPEAAVIAKLETGLPTALAAALATAPATTSTIDKPATPIGAAPIGAAPIGDGAIGDGAIGDGAIGDGAKFVPAQWIRQYVGVTRGGQRLIIGNLLRRAELPALREEVMDRHPEHDPTQYYAMEPFFVCDSAQGNFGFEYDPQSGAFSRIAADSRRSRHVSRYAYDIAPPPAPGKH